MRAERLRSSPGAIVMACLLGAVFGIGVSTFDYAEGLSYFSKDPAACANCHIMLPQYDSWQKSSHHTVATCVDCHLPHTFVAKYIAKADNGYRHSRAFTLQDFHEPIQIIERNKRILQENCIECHREVVHELVEGARSDSNVGTCVHCHRSVGHGERVGLGGYDAALRREEVK